MINQTQKIAEKVYKMDKKTPLEKAFQSARVLTIDDPSRLILFSDCHRGQGNSGDNFLANQNLFFAALTYYYENGYTYIELGDGDELWENRRLKPIIEVHSDAFWLMSRFYQEGRMHMIYGNHDMVKKQPGFCKASYCSYYDECARQLLPLFPDIQVTEGIVLNYRPASQNIFLVHGHQEDFFNCALWSLSRFLVRYLWRPFELIGFLDPTGAGRTHEKKEKIDERLSRFASDNNLMLIAGHTHRPVFAKPGSPPYFNDGSCVHPRCITGIEITDGAIALIKWSVRTKENQSLCVAREVLEGPMPITSYIFHS